MNIEEILKLHGLRLRSEEGGKRADLTGVNLSAAVMFDGWKLERNS